MMKSPTLSFTGLLLHGLLLLVSSQSALANERIVSLNGSLTEIVYALGQEHRLVGVDTTSQYPAAATELASVGYQRALSAEGIVSLQPTLILSTNHAGPQAALEQISSLGVERVQLQEHYTLNSVLEKIGKVSQALDKEGEGQALADQITAQVQQEKAKIPDNGNKPKTLFFIGTGNGSPSVAGAQTAANAMITMAGGHNPFEEDYTGYKPVNAEAMLVAAPEVILVSSRAFDSSGGIEGILALPGVQNTPAGINRRIYSVDTLLTLGFGPRLPLAISSMVSKLHHLN